MSLGQNVTFSVNAGGTLPLTYQWYYNTNTLLSVGTNSTLTLTNVQPSDAGGYSVIVTNSYGSATSVVAQLTVNIFLLRSTMIRKTSPLWWARILRSVFRPAAPRL